MMAGRGSQVYNHPTRDPYEILQVVYSNLTLRAGTSSLYTPALIVTYSRHQTHSIMEILKHAHANTIVTDMPHVGFTRHDSIRAHNASNRKTVCAISVGIVVR